MQLSVPNISSVGVLRPSIRIAPNPAASSRFPPRRPVQLLPSRVRLIRKSPKAKTHTLLRHPVPLSRTRASDAVRHAADESALRRARQQLKFQGDQALAPAPGPLTIFRPTDLDSRVAKAPGQ